MKPFDFEKWEAVVKPPEGVERRHPAWVRKLQDGVMEVSGTCQKLVPPPTPQQDLEECFRGGVNRFPVTILNGDTVLGEWAPGTLQLDGEPRRFQGADGEWYVEYAFTHTPTDKPTIVEKENPA